MISGFTSSLSRVTRWRFTPGPVGRPLRAFFTFVIPVLIVVNVPARMLVLPLETKYWPLAGVRDSGDGRLPGRLPLGVSDGARQLSQREQLIWSAGIYYRFWIFRGAAFVSPFVDKAVPGRENACVENLFGANPLSARRCECRNLLGQIF